MMPLDPAQPAPDPVEAPAPNAPPPVDPERLPMSEKQLAIWKTEISQADADWKTFEPWCEAALKDYWDSAKNPDLYQGTINTLRPFVLVERKRADLFYQRPDLSLVPSPLLDTPMPGPVDPKTGQPSQIPQSAALESMETIVNEYLGPEWIDAKKLAHEVLFDVLCTAGVGATKLGYEAVTSEQETIDPMTGEPRTVPVPVTEKCYWDYIAPKQFRRPRGFRSTDWDRAPWLGFRFSLPLTPGNRQKYHLPDDFEGSSATQEQHFESAAPSDQVQKVFTGIEVWYQSSIYREDQIHPDHYTQLVFVDGLEEPRIHKDSPHQDFLPNGSLSPTSLIGNPIHPFNIRSLTDSAYPPSDIMVTRPLSRELDLFREQMVQSRDAMILRWQYNVDVLPEKALGKIVRSPIGGMIGLPSEAFASDSIKELPHGSFPRETFTSNDYINNDLERATGLDAAGSGVSSQGSTTATEVQTVQANANARFDFERAVFLDRYLRGATKLATLIMRWLPVQQAAEIVGPQKAGIWDQWRKTAKATCAWTALPDSALRADMAVMRRDLVDLYTRVAQDPYMQAIRPKVAEKMLRSYHIEATGMIQPPPPPKPEPPKLNLSFSGVDLVSPQGPIVLEILAQLGVQVKPETVQIAMAAMQQSLEMAAQAKADEQTQAEGDPRHGGMTPEVPSLTKHQDSGGIQGTGAPGAMGAAGGAVM